MQDIAYLRRVRLERRNQQVGWRYNNASSAALVESKNVQGQGKEDRAARLLSEAFCTKTGACASTVAQSCSAKSLTDIDLCTKR